MVIFECKKIFYKAGGVFGLERQVKRLPMKIHTTAGLKQSI